MPRRRRPRVRVARTGAEPSGGRAMKQSRPAEVARVTSVVPVPPGFADGIDDFLGYIELERGLSRNTAKSYENDLRQAAHTLKRLGASDWVKVTPKHLTGWLHWLNDEKFTESSQARKLAAARMLFRYLVRENRRPDDPAALLSGPKFRRKLPQTLTPSEISRLLAAPTGADAYAP